MICWHTNNCSNGFCWYGWIIFLFCIFVLNVGFKSFSMGKCFNNCFFAFDYSGGYSILPIIVRNSTQNDFIDYLEIYRKEEKLISIFSIESHLYRKMYVECLYFPSFFHFHVQSCMEKKRKSFESQMREDNWPCLDFLCWYKFCVYFSTFSSLFDPKLYISR